MRISDWSSDVCSSDRGDANVARRVIIVPLLTNLYFLASARRVADVLAELGAPGVLIDLLALLHDVFERRRINGRALGVRAHHEFPGFVTDRIAPRGLERPLVGAATARKIARPRAKTERQRDVKGKR